MNRKGGSPSVRDQRAKAQTIQCHYDVIHIQKSMFRVYADDPKYKWKLQITLDIKHWRMNPIF